MMKLVMATLPHLGVLGVLLVSGCVDCEEIKDEAFELRERHAACSEGDECQVVSMYEIVGANNCLLAFQCSHALNANTDLDTFERKARSLSENFERCGECAQAGCDSPENKVAVCNTETGLCELVTEEP